MIDRRAAVLIGAFAAGYLCADLPHTLAGFTCGLCVAFLVGVFGRGQLGRWTDDGGGEP